MSTTTVRIHIDELVLHGFDARSRHAIGDAVQAELQRRLARDPAFARELVARTPATQGIALQRLDAPVVALSAHAQRDGRAIGAAIHHSVASIGRITPTASRAPRP